MTRIQAFVLFFLLTALFSGSPRKDLVSKAKRKRPKKSSIGTYVKEIKHDMEQLGADHEKIIGMVLCISLHTIRVLVKIRRNGVFDNQKDGERTWIGSWKRRWITII